MKKVKLALRKTPAANASWLGVVTCKITQERLVSDYCHGGIVVDNVLYHMTANDGLKKSEKYTPELWDLFDASHVAKSAQVIDIYEKTKHAKYNWAGLLAFAGLAKVGEAIAKYWGVKDALWLYCYEWQWYALTGVAPTQRITPEKLLALVAKK